MKDLDQMTKEDQYEYFLWLLGHSPSVKSVDIAEDFYLELITLREAIKMLEDL